MQKSHKFSLSTLTTLIVLTAFTGCSDNSGDSAAQASAPPPAVSVVAVNLEPIGAVHEFAGRTGANETVELRARVEGYLQSSSFTEGSMVKKGQKLFTIDPAPFEAALAQAKAGLASAKAEAARAKSDLTRGRELSPKGFISRSDLDTLTAAEATAKASVASAEAQLKSAQINLSYTTIYAPFSGLIGKETYSVGSLVGSSTQALAELINIDPIYVNFQANEKLLLQYHQSVPSIEKASNAYSITLKLPNNQIYGQHGTLNFADVKVDETTGTVDIRAEFPNPTRQLLPGMYVTIRIESTQKTEMPLIPQFAVQENQQGRFVLVVTADNKVESRNVTLGRRIGPMWAVESGLKEGEQIIVSGLQKVRPNITVNPQLMNVNTETGVLTPAAGVLAKEAGTQ